MPLTVPETTERMVRDWYRALDTHEPVATLLAMLQPDGLVMVFPEATLHGTEAFIGWYEGVIRIFFDEAHHVESVSAVAGGAERMDIKVVVRWEASRWNAPATKSNRIALLAYQSWTVVTDADGKPRIETYTVDRLEYLPGSAKL